MPVMVRSTATSRRRRAGVERALEVAAPSRSRAPGAGSTTGTSSSGPRSTGRPTPGSGSWAPDRRARSGRPLRGEGLRPGLQRRRPHDTVGAPGQPPVWSSATARRSGRCPTSMGMGGVRKYTTTNGVHLAMEKEYMTVMTSAGASGRARRATTSRPSTGRCASPTAASTCTARPGRWAPRAARTSAMAASTSARRTPSGSTTSASGATRSGDHGHRPGAGAENGWGYWQVNWQEWLKGSKAQGFATGTLEGSASPAGTRTPVGSSDVSERRQELRSP